LPADDLALARKMLGDRLPPSVDVCAGIMITSFAFGLERTETARLRLAERASVAHDREIAQRRRMVQSDERANARTVIESGQASLLGEWLINRPDDIEKIIQWLDRHPIPAAELSASRIFAEAFERMHPRDQQLVLQEALTAIAQHAPEVAGALGKDRSLADWMVNRTETPPADRS
jgi:hypothetical protein